MDGRTDQLREKLNRLILEAAEASVELDRADGTIQGVPHYSVIELRAHELGQQLSRKIQERQMAETVASETTKCKCPDCGTRCELVAKKRAVKSIDGQIELQDLHSWFPSM